MKPIVAIVQAVLSGQHGEYVVTTSREIIGSITFSLREEVWHESIAPERGMWVVLNDLHRKQAGWRAQSARLYRVGDEQLVGQPS